MFDFCARIFHHYSVNYVSTDLTNISLRTGYAINDLR